MIETTLYQILSACLASFAVGFALCNVIYQCAKRPTEKRKPRLEKPAEKKRPTRLDAWLERKHHPIVFFFIAMAAGFVTSLIMKVL